MVKLKGQDVREVPTMYMRREIIAVRARALTVPIEANWPSNGNLKLRVEFGY